MTEADALRMLRGLLKAQGQPADEVTSTDLSLSTGDVDLHFELVDGALRCRSELHHFRRAPAADPTLRLGAPKIGRVVLDGDRLFLEHSCRRAIPLTRWVLEIDALLEETRAWLTQRLTDELGQK